MAQTKAQRSESARKAAATRQSRAANKAAGDVVSKGKQAAKSAGKAVKQAGKAMDTGTRGSSGKRSS